MSHVNLATGLKRPLLVTAITVAVLLLAFFLGRSPSPFYLAALLAIGPAVVIMRHLRLGLLALIALALVLPLPISTGSEVSLRPVALLVPALCLLVLMGLLLRKKYVLPSSAVHLPLGLFLVAGLISLGIGNIIWDPEVPRKANFILVQTAQWGIFAFSACAFWLTAILADQEIWLRRMVATFLIVGGVLALLRVCPLTFPMYLALSSGAVDRAPFWMLLVALAGGQLLFNRQLNRLLQVALVVLLAAAIYYCFFLERATAAFWVGAAAAAGVLVWLRFPRVRMPIVLVFAVLLTTGKVSSAIWDFAGGDDEWLESGGSRIALIQRVVEVTMRNPITGLGPAAYRPYANMKPMQYGRAYWLTPLINSHNNYVDLFAHTGLVGLGIFLWFMTALALLGGRLHRRYSQGFLAGYVNGMLAAIAGSIVIMFLLDWILPFVYNVGFLGFQASVLVWLFLGGLVAIDQWPAPDPACA